MRLDGLLPRQATELLPEHRVHMLFMPHKHGKKKTELQAKLLILFSREAAVPGKTNRGEPTEGPQSRAHPSLMGTGTTVTLGASASMLFAVSTDWRAPHHSH